MQHKQCFVWTVSVLYGQSLDYPNSLCIGRRTVSKSSEQFPCHLVKTNICSAAKTFWVFARTFWIFAKTFWIAMLPYQATSVQREWVLDNREVNSEEKISFNSTEKCKVK